MSIPDEVFKVFNALIRENYNGCSATFTQPEVVCRLMNTGLKSKHIFERGWLNIETYYRAVGWTVREVERNRCVRTTAGRLIWKNRNGLTT